ncbi:MAG: hypothetical protein KIS92_08415 [Planctomycetota bacterium]|nr:hypothetical protein [Planctomycetota bacterium]
MGACGLAGALALWLNGCGLGANAQRADQAKEDLHRYSQMQEDNIAHLPEANRAWVNDHPKRAGDTKEDFHRYSQHQEDGIARLEEDAREAIGPKGDVKQMPMQGK